MLALYQPQHAPFYANCCSCCCCIYQRITVHCLRICNCSIDFLLAKRLADGRNQLGYIYIYSLWVFVCVCVPMRAFYQNNVAALLLFFFSAGPDDLTRRIHSFCFSIRIRSRIRFSDCNFISSSLTMRAVADVSIYCGRWCEWLLRFAPQINCADFSTLAVSKPAKM